MGCSLLWKKSHLPDRSRTAKLGQDAVLGQLLCGLRHLCLFHVKQQCGTDRISIFAQSTFVPNRKNLHEWRGYSTAFLCLCSCSKKYMYICLPYSNVCAVCAHLCKPPCFVGRKCCIVFSVSSHQCQNFPHRVCCKYHRLAMMAGNLQTKIHIGFR